MAKKTTKLTDLDEDALVQCASHLRAEDIGSLSVTCKYFNRVYYPDNIWLPHLAHWPRVRVPDSGVREAFYSRQAAMRKFGFSDPWYQVHEFGGGPIYHAVMDKENFVSAQDDVIVTMLIDQPIRVDGSDKILYGVETDTIVMAHSEKITCMRLFPLGKNSEEKLLVASSFDHTIRLWRKGSRQRYFRGHTGPVLILSDELLGDESTKLLASGGEDGIVRLWSVGSTRKRAT